MIKTTIKLAHCTSTIPRGGEGIKVFSCPPFNQPKVSYYALIERTHCVLHTIRTHTHIALSSHTLFTFFLFLSFFLSCTGTTHFIILRHSLFFWTVAVTFIPTPHCLLDSIAPLFLSFLFRLLAILTLFSFSNLSLVATQYSNPGNNTTETHIQPVHEWKLEWMLAMDPSHCSIVVLDHSNTRPYRIQLFDDDEDDDNSPEYISILKKVFGQGIYL